MRPRKKKAEQKGEMLRIRVTDAQKAAFDEAAQRLGMDLSAYARMALIERARNDGIKI